MNNKNESLNDPYGVVCAYACPSTDWRPTTFDHPEEIIPKPSIKFDNTEIGTDYIISGSMMTFYGVDTPEKRLKMIETFEELKKL